MISVNIFGLDVGQPCGLDANGHVGQHEGHGLMVDDRDSEGFSLGSVLGGLI